MHSVIDNVGPKLQEAIAHVEKPSADVTGRDFSKTNLCNDSALPKKLI